MNKKYIKPEFTSIEISNQSIMTGSDIAKGSTTVGKDDVELGTGENLSSGYRSGLWN